MPRKLTTTDFINKANNVWGNKYDYSLVDYQGTDVPVKIICNKHGIFEMTPHHHISDKRGCSKCSMVQDTETFIEKAKELYGDKYNYSEVLYSDSREKIKIICPFHGVFYQRASSHLAGTQCPECGKIIMGEKHQKSQEQFIRDCKAMHGDTYDLSKVKYESVLKPIEVICKKHGSFYTLPTNFIRGTGCPVCKESVLETQVRKLLDDNHIKYIPQAKFDWLRYDYPQSIDFYLPDKNIGIECQGGQHFYIGTFSSSRSDLKYQKDRDDNKRKLCEKNGVKLLFYTRESKSAQKTVPYKCIDSLQELLKQII